MEGNRFARRSEDIISSTDWTRNLSGPYTITGALALLRTLGRNKATPSFLVLLLVPDLWVWGQVGKPETNVCII